MVIKAERLTQRIQEIRSFASERVQHHELSAQVIQSLDQIAIAAQQKKLTLHWIQGMGSSTSSLLSLKKQIEQHPLLSEFYEIHTLQLEADFADWSHYLDCDVLCFVQPELNLTSVEKQLFYQAGSGTIAKQFLLIELPQTTELETLTSIKTVAAETDFEVVILPSQDLSFVESPAIAANNSKKNDPFLKSLELLVRRKPEDILARRMAVKVLAEIARLEHFFAIESDTLDYQIKQIQQQSDPAQHNQALELKAQFEQNLKQAQETSKLLFKQLRSEIEQSKGQLLDEFNRKSLHHQIQLFVNRLQPVLIRNGSAKYVRLQADFVTTSTDVNVDMIQLCYDYLNQWAIAEWQRIYSAYNGGGINYIFQHIYSLVSIVPSLSFGNDFQPGEQSLPLKSFKQPIATLPCESYFKEASLWNYLIRQLRNQWMGIMFLFTFVTVIGIAPNKRQLLQSLFVPFSFLKNQPIWLTIALAIPLCSVFLWLFYSYDNDSGSKLMDEADKLRKSLRDYYQKFAKYAVEKLAVDFDTILSAEERRLLLLLEEVRDRVRLHLAASEQQKSIIQQELQRLILKHKDLEKVKSELHKLKQL